MSRLPSMPRRAILSLGLPLAAFVLLNPGLVSGQVLQGHVVDDSTQVGIDGATVALILGETRLQATMADSSGWFFFTLPDSGSYRVEAQRIGYAAARSQPLFISRQDTVTVEFRLRTRVVLLAPLIVTARKDRGWSRFHDRMESWGRGVYLTPEMVDSISPRHPADVLRNQEKTWLSWSWGQRQAVPSIRTFLGSGCVAYVLDGREIDTDFWGGTWEDSPLGWITGEDVIAVEYYRYIGEVPPELRRFAVADDGIRQCGLVAFWTAVGWE